MKNLILLFFLFISGAVTLQAQSFTGTTSATTGSVITLTGVGEAAPAYNTSNYYFTGVTAISDLSVASSNANDVNYVGVTLTEVTSLYSNTGTATTIKLTVRNIYTSAITVTFNIHVNYLTWMAQGSDQKVAYTITIQPAPTVNPPTSGAWWGGFGGTPAQIGAGPDGGYGGTLTNYLWRLQRPSNNQHFYTANHSELVNLVNQTQGTFPTTSFHTVYNYEGSIGYVFKASQPGTVPLMRLMKNGDHFYTIDQNEANSLLGSGWVSEGNSGYVYSSSQSNTMPVYRYMARSGQAGHFFTSDKNELGNGNSSWTYEGIAYYILSAPQ